MIPTFSMSSAEVDKAFAKLKRVSVEMEADMMRLVTKTAQDIQREAVANLEKNRTNVDGRLRSSLRFVADSRGRLSASVRTSLFYAPYVEFGTKHRFGKIHKKAGGGTVDPDLHAIAAQYRGSTGQKGLEEAIRAWAKKKGIPADVVGAIYVSIARHGTFAQPFLFPAAKKVKPGYIKSLERIVKRYSAK
jgi:HK97 gp10 family phage protein